MTQAAAASMVGLIPVAIAAGIVLVFSRQAAKQAWPEEKINKYEIRWKEDKTKNKGKRFLYAPTEEEASEGFETKFPKRHVTNIREV